MTQQQVNVFVNEIKQLAGFTKFLGKELNNRVRLSNRFPNNSSRNLQQLSGIMTKFMSNIISRGIILCSTGFKSDIVDVRLKNRPT